jgi:hypothetical protein
MNECVVAIKKNNVWNFRGANFQKSANFHPLWALNNALGQVQKFLIQCSRLFTQLRARCQKNGT